jgi:glycine/D-amino acid oxidase-like deaminating enzyme
MSADRVDVVIIGAGLAGSATAWALARRGRSAVVLEAFQPGHRRGSSHGSSRIFRRAYLDPFYVQLTGEAQRRWLQLADEAGEELVLATGGIDFGPAPRAGEDVRDPAGVQGARRAAGGGGGR